MFSVLIAGVASLAYMRWGGSSAETSDPRIVSVTSLPGLESSPSISPDGNFVVFSWTGPNPEGIPDLWVSAVDRDSRQRLTETPTAAETSPAWSPNGRDIAFIRVGEGVFVVPALGGPEQKVGDSGSMVAWMPDGRSLLVRDGRPEAGTPYGIFRSTARRPSGPRSRTRPAESATRRSTSLQTDGRWHSSDTSGRVSAMSMSLPLPAVKLTAARTGIPRSAASRGRPTGATSCTPSSKSLASTRRCFGFQPSEIDSTGASGRCT